MNDAIRTWSPTRMAGTAILVLAGWYVTNFLMNLFNVVFFVTIGGAKIDFSVLQYSALWGDRIGWGHFFGPWPSYLYPALIVLVLILAKIDLTWKLAARIGLAIVVAQIGFMATACLLGGRLSPIDPSYFIFYFARLWEILPGIIVAAAAWRVNLDHDLFTA